MWKDEEKNGRGLKKDSRVKTNQEEIVARGGKIKKKDEEYCKKKGRRIVFSEEIPGKVRIR
jgi:hypothetical protein